MSMDMLLVVVVLIVSISSNINGNNGFLPSTLVDAEAAANKIVPSMSRLNMIHVPKHMSHLMKADHARLETRRIARELAENPNKDVKLKIFPGAESGIGQYLIPFKVGTPPQNFLLIPDSGSDLNWIRCRWQCHNCSGKNHRDRTRRRFHADNSYSFKPLSCIEDRCKGFREAYADCPVPQCSYNYHYMDDSWARGILANETVTVGLADGGELGLEQITIGCSRNAKGIKADGVLSLVNSAYSFANQAMERFGYKFSYCLIDHMEPENVSSYIVFGSGQEYQERPNMQYTQIFLVQDIFYGIIVNGVTLDREMLDIPAYVWDERKKFGTIMDSGSTATYLVPEAYDILVPRLISALKPRVTHVFREDLQGTFEFCFSSTGYDGSMVPKLAFHLHDGIRFEPPVQNYVIDTMLDVRCLGIMRLNGTTANMFGNILQQNFLWEYDLVNWRLGFAPSTCK